MTIHIPWGLIALFMAFYFFYAYNRKTRLRRQERREVLKKYRKEYLNQTFQSNAASAQNKIEKSEQDIGSDVIND